MAESLQFTGLSTAPISRFLKPLEARLKKGIKNQVTLQFLNILSGLLTQESERGAKWVTIVTDADFQLIKCCGQEAWNRRMLNESWRN